MRILTNNFLLLFSSLKERNNFRLKGTKSFQNKFIKNKWKKKEKKEKRNEKKKKGKNKWKKKEKRKKEMNKKKKKWMNFYFVQFFKNKFFSSRANLTEHFIKVIGLILHCFSQKIFIYKSLLFLLYLLLIDCRRNKQIFIKFGKRNPLTTRRVSTAIEWEIQGNSYFQRFPEYFTIEMIKKV